MKRLIMFVLLMSWCVSCTPPPLLCILTFGESDETYNFTVSKDKLKDRIVEAYTYDETTWSKNFGMTIIDNKAIAETYGMHIDKKNWNQFKLKVRSETADTLDIRMYKFHSRGGIDLQVIVDGDDKHSSLRIVKTRYTRKRACEDTVASRNKARQWYVKDFIGQLK